MVDEEPLASFFEQLQLGMFEYLGRGDFRPIVPLPRFIFAILGSGAANAPVLRLGDLMPFLDNFIIDAEEFWNSHVEGRAESGPWIEEDEQKRQLALEASAMRVANRRVMIIQNGEERQQERARALQATHESLLQRDRVLREMQKKEILLHHIVHDLSQPLTAIRGALSLLRLAPLSTEFVEALGIAERQAEKQQTMIRAILEVFAAEVAAQQTLERDPNKAPDLARCAEKTVETFRSAFMDRGARIVLAPEIPRNAVWRVVGEESRLMRVFGNLVENGLRHSPPGSTLTVGAVDEGNYAIGFVDDEGAGLPLDVTAAQLFTPFVQGKHELAGKAGLGLHFCKITVERWGGTIGCANRPCAGAHFWFRLPRITGETAKTPSK